MNTKQAEFRVANLDCESEAAAIQRGMKQLTGLLGLQVYPKAAKVVVNYNPEEISVETIKANLAQLGFPAQGGRTMFKKPKPWRNPKVITSALSGALLLAGWILSVIGLTSPVSFGFYLAAMLMGGYYFAREAVEDLVFEHEIGIELLMSIAALVATVMGQAAEGAILAFLYSISEAAEGYTEEKTRSAIRALMDLTPKTALVRKDGTEIEIPVEDLMIGDLFIVKPGQSMPTDGVIEKGASSINESPITGESIPVEKQPGDSVFAGTINGESALEVRAEKKFSDNTVARIIHLVEEAQEKKGKSQSFIERFGARYSPAVLLAGVLLALLPPLAFQAQWSTWIIRATVFVVAAAPCALVISIPITLVASLGTAARQGVLIKGGLFLEELAKVRVVAMDKTGTITVGKPEVTAVAVLRNERVHSESELLAVAAGLELRSEHPLARAILRHAESRGTSPALVSDFRALPGAGAMGTLNGSSAYIGSPQFFAGRGIALNGSSDVVGRLQEEGNTVVMVGDDSTVWGVIAIRDQVRPNARKAVADLHTTGIQKVVMVTGDNERSARAIAAQVGIDEVHADLKPEDKVIAIHKLADLYGHVAMVGDGINDAPALAAATVGVAMGAAGTDIALETADVALMADDLEKLVYALQLARRNQRVVRQNLLLSIMVIGFLVIGAVAGMFNLPIAVLGHEISEFVVIGSGLRMLRS